MRDLNTLLDDRTAWRLPEVGVCSASLRRSKEMLNGGSSAGEGCGSSWMDLKAEPARRKKGGERRTGVGVAAEHGCRPGVSACLTTPSFLRSSATPSSCFQGPGASDCQSCQALGPAPSGDSAGPFFSLPGKSTALPTFPLPVLTGISSPVLSSQRCLSFDATEKVTVF